MTRRTRRFFLFALQELQTRSSAPQLRSSSAAASSTYVFFLRLFARVVLRFEHGSLYLQMLRVRKPLTDEQKARKAEQDKERRQTDEYKEAAKKRRQTAKYKAAQKQHRQTAEYKAAKKVRDQSAKYKEAKKDHEQTDEYKEAAKKRRQTAEYKAADKERKQATAYKEAQKERVQTAEYKEARKDRRARGFLPEGTPATIILAARKQQSVVAAKNKNQNLARSLGL